MYKYYSPHLIRSFSDRWLYSLTGKHPHLVHLGRVYRNNFRRRRRLIAELELLGWSRAKIKASSDLLRMEECLDRLLEVAGDVMGERSFVGIRNAPRRRVSNEEMAQLIMTSQEAFTSWIEEHWSGEE